MATVTSQAPEFSPRQFGPYTGNGLPDYITLSDYLNAVDDPDYTRQVVKKFKQDLDIIPLLMASSREFPVQRDANLFHWEETRRYVSGSATAGAAIAPGDSGSVVFSDADHRVRTGDNLNIIIGGDRVAVQVTAVTVGVSFAATPKDSTWGITVSNGGVVNYNVYGNEFGKGTNQPTQFIVDNLDRKETTLSIMKDRFTMTGDQMTDRSRVEVPGKGEAYIYYAEMQSYARFLAYKEMKYLYDVQVTNANLTTTQGTRGLIRAIEEDGNVMGGYIDTLDQIDDLTAVLDSQGGEDKYLVAVNTRQYSRLQNMLSANSGDIAYGMFDNDANGEITLGLGFRGFHRNGYDFFMKKAAFLNNPQIGGLADREIGFLIPQGVVRDAQTGNVMPNLSILYKEMNGYNRRMESQMTGFAGDIKGHPDGFDGVNVDYRCQDGLRTAAMNKFVLLKK